MTMIISGSDGLEFPDGSDQGTAFTGNAATITSGTIATARLATGTANSSTYLRGDQTWAAIASSQWVTSGANISYTTGNVGIGTSSPGASYKLDVTGNTRTTGYLSLNDNGYVRSSSGYLDLQGGSTGTRFMDSAYGTQLMQITQAGNIYVGADTTCNLLDFRSKSLSANGYQRIAGGLIIQWGSFGFSASATGTVTLPLTFPSSFASASYTTNFGGGQNTFNWTIGLYPTSTSTFAWTNASSSAGGTAYWIAIGY